MRFIFILLFLSLGALSYGQNEAETTCNIDNYRDYIYTQGEHKCDLSGANLYMADLSNANLSGANLYMANLRNANLYMADLSNAKLYMADLYRANLRDANVREANLQRASMRGANLRDANLRDANLYMADLFLSKWGIRWADFYMAKVDRFGAYFLHSLGVKSGFIVVDEDPAENIINE